MKRLCFRKLKTTKRGVASLYVVIFATMVFGIVSLSCMRIMLSEVTQSSEDDLSRSAYDAAMAGVEDAKTAVNRYYKCLSGSGNANYCNLDARTQIFQSDCNDSIGIAQYLYRGEYLPSDNPEVLIQEGNTDNNSDQAYTCVIVSDVTPDYRGSLTHDTRTRVIPLSVKSNDMTTNKISDVKTIRFSWFSQLNENRAEGGNAGGFKNLIPDGKFGDANQATVPPTIQLTLLIADENLNIDDLHKANNGANYSTVVLLPTASQTNAAVKTISSSELATAGNNGHDSNGQNITHKPIEVTCSTTTDFACTVDLQVNIASGSTVFLIASLPYGDTISDFSVSMLNSSNEIVYFQGSQISVDSTGRTGQLVRRVETRLEPSDLYFPYPMYALDLGGDDEDSKLAKDFWITANCWYARKIDGNFEASTCPNNNNDNAHSH